MHGAGGCASCPRRKERMGTFRPALHVAEAAVGVNRNDAATRVRCAALCYWTPAFGTTVWGLSGGSTRECFDSKL